MKLIKRLIKLSSKTRLILTYIRLPKDQDNGHGKANSEGYYAYLSVNKPTIMIGKYALRIINDKCEYGLFRLFIDKDNNAMFDFINNHTEDAMYLSIIRIDKETFGLNVTDTINRSAQPDEGRRLLAREFTEAFAPVIKLFINKVLDKTLDCNRLW